MKDKILGIIEDGKCPKCGKRKVVAIGQFPLIVELDMKGRPIFRRWTDDSRIYRVSNHRKASTFDEAIRDNYQCLNYTCRSCGWVSETYTP